MSDHQGYDDASRQVRALTSDLAWRDAAALATRGRAPLSEPFELARLVDALPSLGAVLWLDRAARRNLPLRATMGAQGVLLLDHPALAVLGGGAPVTAHTAVTTHGPREWLCFRDDGGEAQAKLFLLPDTDYLAWDEMIAHSHVAPPQEPPNRWQARATSLRCALAHLGLGWRARLLVFDLKRMPWLRRLGTRPPLRVSLLGLEIARAITRAECADFVAPLHIA